jgi:hypothetical protein
LNLHPVRHPTEKVNKYGNIIKSIGGIITSFALRPHFYCGEKGFQNITGFAVNRRRRAYAFRYIKPPGVKTPMAVNARETGLGTR